jgi:hypothetical protein
VHGERERIAAQLRTAIGKVPEPGRSEMQAEVDKAAAEAEAAAADAKRPRGAGNPNGVFARLIPSLLEALPSLPDGQRRTVLYQASGLPVDSEDTAKMVRVACDYAYKMYGQTTQFARWAKTVTERCDWGYQNYRHVVLGEALPDAALAAAARKIDPRRRGMTGQGGEGAHVKSGFFSVLAGVQGLLWAATLAVLAAFLLFRRRLRRTATVASVSGSRNNGLGV